MKLSAKKMIKMITVLCMICCMVVLFGCGGPKYPKADLEVTGVEVNKYMANLIITRGLCNERNKPFTATDLAADYTGKVVRLRGKAFNSAKHPKTGKPVIVLEREGIGATGGQVVVCSIANFKDNLSPQAEKKATNKEYIVVQGILKGMKITPIKNDVVSFWHIEDAVIIENDEFNTDGKADAVIKSYSKQIDNIRNN